MFESIIFPAMSLGLSAASLPGALQSYLLNVTLNYGWKRAFLVIICPLIIDGPIIIATVFILDAIPDWWLQFIRFAGGLLLLWIAYGAWQQLKAGAEFKAEKKKGEGSPKEIFITALGMNLLSPGPYLFWSTVTGPLLKEALAISPLAALGMLLGFYGVFLGGMVVLVFIVYRLGKLGNLITRYLLVATIALLLWFGTQLILVDALNIVWLHQLFTLGIVLGLLIYLWQARQKTSLETR